MPAWPDLIRALAQQGLECDPADVPRAVGGGDASEAWQLATRRGPVFLKTAAPGAYDVLDAEREALIELAAAGAVRVPAVLALVGTASGSALALEWLELQAPDEAANRQLGTQLAVLHRCTGEHFGWHRDNTIGRTPQPNAPCDDWPTFFRRQRLGHQLALLANNGRGRALLADGDRLCRHLERLFDDYAPAPSLLHGDLWAGNRAACEGQPVLYDPALYYGDRESDLAMTRLFGGFSAAFYDAYEASWPLAPGHENRLLLYQLYHVLNHLNLFGGGYHGQAGRLLQRLRRAIG